jgi:dimethylargininase
VPTSFARALSIAPPDPPIDVDRARAQHLGYLAALEASGLVIIRMADDDSCPDCCFVEDTAVIAGGVALMTRPAMDSRRGEIAAVASALADHCELAAMESPATLEGGDCLRLGRTIFVGISARSNAAGAARLREVFAPRGYRVVTVEVPDGLLHLKSACSGAGGDRVLIAEGTVHGAWFAGAEVLVVPAAESFAANIIEHRGTALVAAGAPRTRELLEAAGVRTLEVDTSELRKADGALTCLSLVVG